MGTIANRLLEIGDQVAIQAEWDRSEIIVTDILEVEHIGEFVKIRIDNTIDCELQHICPIFYGHNNSSQLISGKIKDEKGEDSDYNEPVIAHTGNGLWGELETLYTDAEDAEKWRKFEYAIHILKESGIKASINILDIEDQE